MRERDVALQKERNALQQATVPLKQFIDVEMTKMLREACAKLNQETGCTAVLDVARNTVMYVVAPEADVSRELRKSRCAVGKEFLSISCDELIFEKKKITMRARFLRHDRFFVCKHVLRY